MMERPLLPHITHNHLIYSLIMTNIDEVVLAINEAHSARDAARPDPRGIIETRNFEHKIVAVSTYRDNGVESKNRTVREAWLEDGWRVLWVTFHASGGTGDVFLPERWHGLPWVNIS